MKPTPRKLILIFLAVLVISFTGCVALPPPGFEKVPNSWSHVTAYGFSVQVPGSPGWIQSKTDYGYVWGLKVDRYESAHAGIRVLKSPPLVDRAAFAAFVKERTKLDTDTFRYKDIDSEFKDDDGEGLWNISGHLAFKDTGANNAGKNEFLRTHTVFRWAMDPRDPERVVTIWYSWRGKDFDAQKFRERSSQFLNSLRREPGSTSPRPSAHPAAR